MGQHNGRWERLIGPEVETIEVVAWSRVLWYLTFSAPFTKTEPRLFATLVIFCLYFYLSFGFVLIPTRR